MAWDSPKAAHFTATDNASGEELHSKTALSVRWLVAAYVETHITDNMIGLNHEHRNQINTYLKQVNQDRKFTVKLFQ